MVETDFRQLLPSRPALPPVENQRPDRERPLRRVHLYPRVWRCPLRRHRRHGRRDRQVSFRISVLTSARFVSSYGESGKH